MSAPIKPHYPPVASLASTLPLEAPSLSSLITTLGLRPHIEGGYFVETDRSPQHIPNPFLPSSSSSSSSSYSSPPGPPRPPPHEKGTHALQLSLESSTDPSGGPGLGPGLGPGPSPAPSLRSQYAQSPTTRSASTSILYLLTPSNPQGYFHKNKARAIHSLVSGRGRYVVVHPDGTIETFVVGRDVMAGEKLSWVVEGDRWKGSLLLPLMGKGERGSGGLGGGDLEGQGEEGLLISETVVPGFEYEDHEFLRWEDRAGVLGTRVQELEFLVRRA
ncbi:hypothetical protein CAC42_507 [Sphaceloma murrayae]|uniref:DUF985 domain-containing protein n=1 Tax=Sphaceloma murrayae TaxID=2082308 RepID=A0A2K1R3N9_9PEZI|nr:hypothetical protein CAC42_507 [Sphaceloma murrayae]